jgi:2,3-bisphosphoglycerate-independent phosphoglycerate mutase
LDALRDHDFVYLHIEASDEAGHEGDVDLKLLTIEYLENRVVKPIFEAIGEQDDVAIAILHDHPTPCAIRTHTSKPVPFVIYKKGQQPDDVQQYDEFSAQKGSYGYLRGVEFIREFLKKE